MERLQEGLNGLDFIAFNAKAEGALAGIERNDQRPLSAARRKNSFAAGQGTTADPHSLSHFQEGMRADRQMVIDYHAYGFDLFVGNGNRLSRRANKSQSPFHPQDTNEFLVSGNQLDEDIAAEQGQLDDFTAITPTMNFFH